MEFLKSILGEDLYKQFETAINAYNGNEANKDNQIKLANLGGGEYVGKGKYDALQAVLDGKDRELTTANGLIADLKKGTKDDEGLQTKITDYETQVAQLQAELQQTKLDNAIKVALLEGKATDVDYLTFKLKAKGDELALDEQGKIKGWDDKLAGLKTQFPAMFEASGNKKFVENKLPDDGKPEGLSKSDILKMPYAERAKLAQENPDAYSAAMNN